MSKKGSNFFEEHIEKITFGIFGAVCVWLLVTRVIMSPDFVRYDNDKFSAGGIDGYIRQQSEVLESKINQEPKAGAEYKPCLGAFISRFDSAISVIDANLYLPQPSFAYMRVVSNRIYAIPKVGEVKNVEAEHIRAVAYVPIEIIGEDRSYQFENSEPNDVDLVTVEGRFDVSGLYERFYSNFAGDNVREEWRDPCLAVPVFAAVQLERQELFSDGSWSEWKIVPRTRVDPHKKVFDITEDVRKMPPGGAKVNQLQLNSPTLRRCLLQPGSYKIASVEEEWLPPSFHKDFLRERQSLKAQEKHEAKTTTKEEGRAERRSRSGRSPTVSAGEEGIVTSTIVSGGDTTRKAAVKKRAERPSEKDAEKGKEGPKSSTNVYSKFDGILLNENTDLAHMEGGLIFWAIDDTVKPGMTCRYRIRVGVFNPVAGTNQFREEDKDLKNNVILWSDFSELSKNVEVPAMLYFFPRDMQEAVQAVVVQVSRCVLGNWYSKDFVVKRGEVIGKVSRLELSESKKWELMPEMINYDTGAVVVNIVPVNDWAGGKELHSRSYFDMLYSFDGAKIEHIPIKIKNWSDKFLAKFNEIKKAEKEPKHSLKDWGGKVTAIPTTTSLKATEVEGI